MNWPNLAYRLLITIFHRIKLIELLPIKYKIEQNFSKTLSNIEQQFNKGNKGLNTNMNIIVYSFMLYLPQSIIGVGSFLWKCIQPISYIAQNIFTGSFVFMSNKHVQRSPESVWIHFFFHIH
jgi:hypothetical protein